MNKTVTINLASILFHIDEEAYNTLNNYLEAIKKSLANEEGKEEIIADIEARIAEIFNEKKQFEQQVINLTDVDDVISIMGQPEDYAVDEEPDSQDSPKTAKSTQVKKLFRDPTDKYAGGVSSGFGHYFGIDPIWIRIAWVLLVLGSSGVFILVYAGFWFFIPKADSTADQLAMKGEPINLSNITKKAREEFENSDLKNKSAVAIDRLGEILSFCLKLIIKLFGIYLIITAGSVLLASALSLFGISLFNTLDPYWSQYVNTFIIGFPLWLVYLLAFFLIGIPSFFILLLGLKIVVKQLKPIGKVASLSLVTLWIISLISLTFFGIKQYTERSFDGAISSNETLNITAQDTIKLVVSQNNTYDSDILPAPFEEFTIQNESYNLDYSGESFKIYEDGNNKKILLFDNVKLFIRSTTDDKAILKLTKKAKGSSNEKAKQRAGAINYKYTIKDNTIYIDPYAIAEYQQKYAEQKIELTLFIPNNSTFFIDPNTSNILHSKNEQGYLSARGKEGHFLNIKENKLICTSCPPKEDWEDEDWEGDNWDYENNDSKGINMNFEDDGDEFKLKIDENGINIEAKDRNGNKSENFKIKIDEDGIKMNNI